MRRLTCGLPVAILALFLATTAFAGVLDDILTPTQGLCARVAAADEAELKRIEASLPKGGAGGGSVAEAQREVERASKEWDGHEAEDIRHSATYTKLLASMQLSERYRGRHGPVSRKITELARGRTELQWGDGRSKGITLLEYMINERNKQKKFATALVYYEAAMRRTRMTRPRRKRPTSMSRSATTTPRCSRPGPPPRVRAPCARMPSRACMPP